MIELAKRSVSGAVFVCCVAGSILYSPYVFCALFLLFAVLAVDEFHRLVQSPMMLRFYAFVSTVVLWFTIACFAWNAKGAQEYRTMGVAMGMLYIPMLTIGLMDEIWNHSGRPLQNWGNLLGSQIMIVFPLASMLFLYFLDKWLVLALFVLIWVNDTGAYCVGSLTAKRAKGNHKMTPHISPKKSWEGLIGGVAFTMCAACLLHYYGWFNSILIHPYEWPIVFNFAFLVSAFGTMGDLMESLMKRSVGVKDSGFFLPGHGGVLDRFDSVLLAAPILTSFCWLCYYIAPLF